jgi:hypothetical protein
MEHDMTQPPTQHISNAAEPAPELTPESAPEPPRVLSPAAVRALAEAEARRAVRDAAASPPAREMGGSKGPDPVRYGDWENGGIASDF